MSEDKEWLDSLKVGDIVACEGEGKMNILCGILFLFVLALPLCVGVVWFMRRVGR